MGHLFYRFRQSCEFFNVIGCTSKLGNQGSKDQRNLNTKLKSHEISDEHITNMNALIDLKIRLSKDKTIDKHAKRQINKDKEHGKNVLLRIIIIIIKTLGKVTQFCVKKMKRSTKKVIEIFMFDRNDGRIRSNYIHRIKNDEIYNYYLRHNIQNQLINLLVSEIKTKIIKKLLM